MTVKEFIVSWTEMIRLGIKSAANAALHLNEDLILGDPQIQFGPESCS